MQISLRQFDTDTVQWFKAASRHPSATRAQLARGLCGREDWHNACGELCESSARKVLLRLAERLGVALPEPRHGPPCRVQLPSVADVSVDTELEGLGEVNLQSVFNAEQGRQFRALMAGHTSGHSPSGASGIWCTVWVKPLAEDWRQRLCAELKRVLGQMGRLHLQGDWAEREFGRSTHPDPRVRAHLVVMGRSWEHNLDQPLPVVFPQWASQQAAYCLLSNRQVDEFGIVEGHQATTSERYHLLGTVLVPQNTA